ncbi:MAG: ATP-binding cassette domain-containing protein [bacterium]
MNERSCNIRISYGKRELVAIDDFRLAESSLNVLLGESGIGKSLIARAIAGLLDPDELDITMNRKPYSDYLQSSEAQEIRRNGFFVFQEPSSHLNPLMMLRNQLNEGSLAAAPDDSAMMERLWGKSSSTRFQDVLDVYPKPYRPSGGEKQRILSAMAFKKISTLLEHPEGALYVFDEPTGNLDDSLRNEFIDLLIETLRQRRITALLITHDYSMINRLTTAYPDFQKQIIFKELVLNRGQLNLRAFLPEEYLDWLESRKSKMLRMVKRDPILKFESGAKIFGRRLMISRDPRGKDQAPLELRRGAMTYLKAPSGTGKTTVVKLMMGLLKPEKMKMSLNGREYTEKSSKKIWQQQLWGRELTMVFQHADEALNQNATVRDVFAGLPLPAMDDEAIIRLLSEFFDEEADREFLGKRVAHLSGGQKQRLNLLRSLSLDTDVVILDEPLNGLDFAGAVKVITKIEERMCGDGGAAFLIISHNEEIFDALVPKDNLFYLRAIADRSPS